MKIDEEPAVGVVIGEVVGGAHREGGLADAAMPSIAVIDGPAPSAAISWVSSAVRPAKSATS
ncbi:hypothetical protein ACFQ0B_44710 [Nonomuraea thailandensis]